MSPVELKIRHSLHTSLRACQYYFWEFYALCSIGICYSLLWHFDMAEHIFQLVLGLSLAFSDFDC